MESNLDQSGVEANLVGTLELASPQKKTKKTSAPYLHIDQECFLMRWNCVLSIFVVRNITSVPLTAFLTNINPHNRGLTRFFFCGRQLTKLDHITKIVELIKI